RPFARAFGIPLSETLSETCRVVESILCNALLTQHAMENQLRPEDRLCGHYRDRHLCDSLHRSNIGSTTPPLLSLQRLLSRFGGAGGRSRFPALAQPKRGPYRLEA